MCVLEAGAVGCSSLLENTATPGPISSLTPPDEQLDSECCGQTGMAEAGLSPLLHYRAHWDGS